MTFKRRFMIAVTLLYDCYQPLWWLPAPI